MKTLKTFLLMISIAVGLALQVGAAHAQNIQTAIFAGGCFWCVEADFDRVKGVVDTTSGYTGGVSKNPTYRFHPGYTEAVRIRFDADVISYRQLVDIFWRTVDVFDAGGQFCDRGSSYRAEVFVAGHSQRAAAKASKAAAEAILKRQIVTPVTDASVFYRAEAYHQNYHTGKNRVLTRYGYIKQVDAYKNYRKACGRDARVRQIWGKLAPFAGM